jgi:pSer/pThr/pTyr-binding forkhead associated (FHA) protein
LDITRDGFTIGRHPSSDLHLTHESISRYHAVIRYDRGRYFIQDQGSTIGTYVNSQRVDACELQSGDVIRIDGTEFQFFVSE